MLLGLFLAPNLHAQDSSCLQRVLPLGITVPEGSRVELNLASFHGTVHNRPVRITSVALDDRPHRVVILLDASGSMQKVWGQVLAVASALANGPLPDTSIALLIFWENTREVIGFSQGQTAVARRLSQLGSDLNASSKLVRGRTAILDWLSDGLDLMPASAPTDSLYIITDGEDDRSRTKEELLARRLTFSGVRVFVSLVSAPRSPVREALDDRQLMSRLAARTGGELLSPYADGVPRTPAEKQRFSQALDSFHRKMIRDYRLEIELPEVLHKPSRWRLTLDSEDKNIRKNVRLVYPSELAACAP